MVKSISKLFQFFIILVLVAAGLQSVESVKLQPQEAKACITPLGACGPLGDCAARCTKAFLEGEGSCNLGLCNCAHWCD
ncbi:unnamed protein product [Lathyrus oleraceus]